MSDAIGSRRPLRRRAAEDGSVSTELVVVTPVLLLLFLAVVQFALWQHAQHVAEAAAQRGAESARVEGGTNVQGQDVAQSAIQQIGGGLLVSPAVSVTRAGGVVTVQVSGTAQQVVPFLSLGVSATAQGPVERFVPQGAGP